MPDDSTGQPVAFYRSNRILVRRIVPADAAIFAAWPNVDLRRFRPGASIDLLSVDGLTERLLALAAFDAPPEIDVIVERTIDGKPIGAMSLSAIDLRNEKAELSVAFVGGRGTRASWEAMHLAFDYAFENLKLRKLIFYSLDDNRAALDLLSHLGAREEGRLIDEIVAEDGQPRTLVRFSLFRDGDWPDLSARLRRIAPLSKSG